jgi:hypothetical protein
MRTEWSDEDEKNFRAAVEAAKRGAIFLAQELAMKIPEEVIDEDILMGRIWTEAGVSF